MSFIVTAPETITMVPRSPSGRRPLARRNSIFLRSPVTPTEANPRNDVDLPDTPERFSEHPHAFHPPGETDSRGPCPALNTLANHGYLSRNGHKITKDDLLAALQHPETYNISAPLALLLVYGGFAMMQKFNAPSMPFHQLAQHGLIEHDASVGHKNTVVGDIFAPTQCDTVLLDKLLDSEFMTLDKVAKRRVELESVSPLDLVHQKIARGEWALVLDVFGREHGGRVPSDALRVWLKENRFPEDWRPTHEQGLFATISKANEISKKMNEYRKYHKESAEECLPKTTLWEGTDSTSPSTAD